MNAAIRAKTRDGGLGVPALTTTIPILKKALFDRLSISTDIRIQDSADILNTRMVQELDGESVEQHKTQERIHWAVKLHDSVDGSGLREATTSPPSSDWVNDGSRLMRGYNYVSALKTRLGVHYTRLRASRGRPGAPIRCDLGCNAAESVGHILQRCPFVAPWRTWRHDRVADLLAQQLTRKGWNVQKEPAIRTPAGLRKPDLIITESNRAVVLDIQVVADSHASTLDSEADNS